MNELTFTYVVSSDSSEALRLAKQLAAGKMKLDDLHTDIGTANSRVYVRQYRLSDYFNAVQIADSNQTSFRLTFIPRHDADGYWKDVVVGILKSLRDSGGVSIRSERNT